MLKIDDRWVRWLLVPAIVFISQATNDAYLSDFWHHLARGREMVRTGRLLDHDIFTYTVPGRAFLDVNWLTQIAYFHLYSLGGLDLVRVVNALVLAGAWAWIVGICKRESGSLEIAMAMGLATFVGAWQVLTIRPQTVSIVLFVGTYDVLLRAERDWRWLCVTPLFLALWANVHGAFPAGLMLIGVFTAAKFATALSALGAGLRPRRCLDRRSPEAPEAIGGTGDLRSGEAAGSQTRAERVWLVLAVWVIACVACAAATLVNPYRFEIYEYARQTSGISARRGIEEWLPPSWEQGIGIAFFVSLPIVIGVLAWSWQAGRRVSWREAFLLALFGYLAATSIRMVLWWLIVIAPMLAVRLADFWPRSRQVTYSPNLGAKLTAIGLLVFCVWSCPQLRAYNPWLVLRTPDETMANLEEAVKEIKGYLQTHSVRGTIFAKLEWGEYLGWTGSPNCKIFMDGRIEIYPDEVWNRYSKITRGQIDTKLSGIKLADLSDADFLILDADFHKQLLDRLKQANIVELRRFGNVVLFVNVQQGFW